MMDFLNKLFLYENFGPILFAIIAVLIVIFFIVLFFGKKDEKERKLEETRRLEELANINAFKEESQVTELEIQDVSEPFVDSYDSEDNNSLEPVFAKSDDSEVSKEVQKENIELETESNDLFKPVEEVPVLSPISELPLVTENDISEVSDVIQIVEPEKEELPFRIEPSIPTNIPKYDFEELANSIARELEEIEKMSSKSIEKEIIKEEPKLELERAHVEVTPIKEIQKRGGMPVFSSVFVPNTNREEVTQEQLPPKIESNEELKTNIEKVSETIFAEEPEVVEKEKINKIDFSKLKSENITVTKPTVEMPKHVELPKKVAEVEKEKIAVPDFSNIEGESYDIK